MSLISPQAASEVLQHFGYEGRRAGGFIEALLTAMVRADNVNLGKLSMQFPGYAAAVSLMRENEEYAVKKLQRIAGVQS